MARRPAGRLQVALSEVSGLGFRMTIQALTLTRLPMSPLNLPEFLLDGLTIENSEFAEVNEGPEARTAELQIDVRIFGGLQIKNHENYRPEMSLNSAIALPETECNIHRVQSLTD